MHCGDQRYAGLYFGQRLRLVPRRSQGTVLSASDVHNAQTIIFDTLYNMEYKMTKKTCQNKTWIEAAFSCINVTLNRYNALAPAFVYVSNDVTAPLNSITSQSLQQNLTVSSSQIWIELVQQEYVADISIYLWLAEVLILEISVHTRSEFTWIWVSIVEQIYTSHSENSHIWQSLSLCDWRWKATVTLGWMGATFSGSGSWKFTWIATL